MDHFWPAIQGMLNFPRRPGMEDGGFFLFFASLHLKKMSKEDFLKP
jgi:hypothetical protein